MRLLIKALLLLAVSGLVLLLLGWLWLSYQAYKPLSGLDAGAVFEVPAGASATAVGSQLERQGVISSGRLFSLWARLERQAASLQAGEYEFSSGASMDEILTSLVSGRVRLHPFTIVEGWTWREVRAALADSEFLRSTTEFESPQGMAAALSWPERPIPERHIEGQLFPDTYRVPRGTTDLQLLAQAAAIMQAKLEQAWQGRNTGLPLNNPEDLLTLASIVERETSLDSERPRVAGVFVRRLQKRMRLQTDPTVIYGMGDRFKGNLTRRDLLTDTPYNTYTRAGLPPTPIAMPGEASLLAAARPAEGDALYFVASAELDGSHVFSATLEQHNAAVAKYVAALRTKRKQRN
jgi:UPF0755 protein